MLNKVLLWAERTFLVAGIIGVGIWAGSELTTSLWQRHQDTAFENAVRSGKAPAILVDNQFLGRISIPRLNLSAMVREGTGNGTLAVAVGHIPGTALPGQNGNVAVAAHRDTLFRSLRNIRNRDLIRFETLRGTYEYQVESTEVVQPQDVGVLKDGPVSELTLVTCYPFSYIGPAPKRFVVKAGQINQIASTR